VKTKNILSSKWFWLGLGLVAGALIIMAIRFATYKPESVHYHANFAVYINGQREQFKEPFYYQESSAACSTSPEAMTPPVRAHMHDNVNDVVHIHDHAVTWGQFFQNNGWVVNPRFINTPKQLYLADDTNKVFFYLNGKTQANIANQVIGDRDKLLVDFGSGDELQKEYNTIASSAIKYDTNKDPASCSGSQPIKASDRLKHLF
jgi:hypothetical protein